MRRQTLRPMSVRSKWRNITTIIITITIIIITTTITTITITTDARPGADEGAGLPTSRLR